MNPILKSGLCQVASDAFRQAGIAASMIGQTIGEAAASAGTHDKDGVDRYGHEYSAATDLRIGGMSDPQVHSLVSKLWDVGFVAFYRNPGHDHWPASDARHVHAIYAGIPMKVSLQNQIHSALKGRNGLASDAEYAFYSPTQRQQNLIRALFLSVNPAVPGGHVAH